MKQVILICVLLAALFIPSSYTQESMVADAAVSCRPPTCFYMGGVYVPSYKKGWYISYGSCLFTVKYYSATGYLQATDYDYNTYGSSSALVYVGNNYAGKSVRIIQLSPEWDFVDGKSRYNTCRIFRYVGP